MWRPSGRGPQSIGNILSELIARKGLARFRGQEEIERAWESAMEAVLGPGSAAGTQVGRLRHGQLEVLVTDPVVLQELNGFHKHRLLDKLRGHAVLETIRDLRFRLDPAT